MQVFNRNVSGRGLTVFGFELVLISGSMVLAANLHGSADEPSAVALKIVLVTALCQLCFYYNDLYDLTVVQSSREVIIRLLQATGAAAIVLAVACVTVPSLILDPSTFLTALGVFVIAVASWRVAFNYFSRDPHLEERVLVVGTGHTAQLVARQIGGQQDFAYRLVGFVDDDEGIEVVRHHEVLGKAADLGAIIAEHQIDRIIVGLSDRRGRLPIHELLQAKLSGVRVEDATTTYERLTGKILLEALRPSALLLADGFRVSRGRRAIKRVADVGLSLGMIVVSAPFIALTALAV